MLKTTLEIDAAAREAFSNIRRIAAEAIADIVVEEFNTLLKEAPQYSGNYVANLALGTSGIARRGGQYHFPKNPTKGQIYRRGDSPAISIAEAANSGFAKKAVAHISGKGGWLTELVVYNRLNYAGIVEAYDEEQLRNENAGAAHALAKMGARLQSRHEVLNLKGV